MIISIFSLRVLLYQVVQILCFQMTNMIPIHNDTLRQNSFVGVKYPALIYRHILHFFLFVEEYPFFKIGSKIIE